MLARHAGETVGAAMLVLGDARLLTRGQVWIVTSRVSSVTHAGAALGNYVWEDEATC